VKAVQPYGYHLLNVNLLLTSAGLTAAIVSPGVSGVPTDEYTDIHSVTISGNDTATQVVTLTDGVVTATYYVSTTARVVEQSLVPRRFGKGRQVVVSAGSVTATKTISVLVRGVTTKT
jgi:hypothetical protein